MRFSIVGAAGLVVDTAVLYATLALGAGLYSGRLVSYIAAASATWAFNRRFTFAGQHDNGSKLVQWAKFLAANALGGLVNYSVYAILVTTSATAASHPVIAVGAGSAAGLAVNYTLSRKFVFKTRNDHRAA